MKLRTLLYSFLLVFHVTGLSGKQIDISSFDFHDGKLLRIEGQWEFYWNRLLTPGDFRLPNEFQPDIVTVPLSWHRQANPYPKLGYATYRTIILLPPGHYNLNILIPQVHCAANIWLNGRLAGKIGKVSTSPRDYEGRISSAVLAVPEGAKQVELVIQVANFTGYKGGLTENMLIGDASAISGNQNINRGLESFFAGSLIAMFIQQLILFLLYRRGTSYLFLSLICLAVAIRAVVTSSSSFLAPDVFPSVSFELWRKAEFFSVYASVALFPLYIGSLFPEQVQKRFLQCLVVLAVALCLPVLLSPLYIYGQLLDIAHTGLLAGFIFTFVTVYRAWKSKNQDAKVIFFGIAASFPFIFAEILKNSFLKAQIPFDMYLVELGVLVFLLFQVYLLGNHYSQSYWKLELYNQRLETMVTLRTEELTHSNEIKNKLLSIVSHDLRSPLQALKGLLNVYNIGAVSKEEIDPFLLKIEDELSGTNILVDNILLWATDQMQGQNIELVKLDLHSLVEEHFNLFLGLAKRKSIAFSNKVAPGITALADKSIVSLVLRNLVSNAIKFTHENGKIEIGCLMETGQVTLTIQDSGIGMTEEQVNFLFTKKLLKSNRGTANEKGAGIGLGLSSDYLKKINGRMWVESSPGAGSRFYVELPGA